MKKKLFYNDTSVEYDNVFLPDKPYPFWINQCGHTYCGSEYSCTRGITSYYTIEYIIAGKGFVQENDTVCRPEAGDTHIFHTGSVQHFHTDPNDLWEKVWIIFYGPLADSLFEIYGLNNYLHFPQLDTQKELMQILEICDDESLSNPEKMRRSSVIVLELVQKLYEYTQKSEHCRAKLSIAEQLKVMIDNMYDFTLSLNDLTSQLFCTRNHAIRAFTTKYGISPYQYMTEKRLRNAKHMLGFSHLSITDIAKSLSFCDSRYFANWFKARTGLTPREYRNELQTEDHLPAESPEEQ